jgi:peptidyl-prolyl cis-trans isomerase D
MISWLQTRFQKHYQVLFLVLLAVIIVAFVFTIGASPGIGTAERSGAQREVFGIPLTTEQDQRDFSEIAQISAYLQSGMPSFADNQLQDYALQRAAALSLANELGIPPPSDTQLAEYITTLRAFADNNGQYDVERYTLFLDSLQTNPGLNEALISHILRDDYRVDQINGLVGGPGYVLDAEVRAQQNRIKTIWSIAEATLSFADFNPEIEPTDEELEAFFADNDFRYEIPERMSVSYVTFEAARLIDSVELSDADVVTYFESNRDRFKKPEPATEGEDATPSSQEVVLADVRDEVEAEMKRVGARNACIQVASDFAYLLFEEQIKPGSDELARILTENGLNKTPVAPFSANEIPADLPWNQRIVSGAFKLTEDHWFSDPLTIGDDVILIFYQDRLAPYTPEFGSVRAQVTADYLEERKRELFVDRGEEIVARLREGLEAGQTFSEAATAVGLETEAWSDFTIQTPPEGMDYNLISRLDPIPVGGVSDMVVTRDAGSILYVVAKNMPADLTEDTDLELTRSQIAALNANVSRSLIYSDMIRDELLRAGLAEAP